VIEDSASAHSSRDIHLADSRSRRHENTGVEMRSQRYWGHLIGVNPFTQMMESTPRPAGMWEAVQAVLGKGLAREEAVLCTGDLRALEARLQPLLRGVGGVLLRGAARLRLADLVRTTGHYFRTHAHRMNYSAFRAHPFSLGSGTIKSGAKNLIQTRQVQAGMRWTTGGAQCLASLRALHRAGRWTTFRHSQPQRHPALGKAFF
jgi:hypothetical protein